MKVYRLFILITYIVLTKIKEKSIVTYKWLQYIATTYNIIRLKERKRSMKKWIGVLFLTFLAAVLVACGENADPNETNGNEEANANEENEEETGDLSAEDVYKKAMEASAEMESAEVEMDMDQIMESGDGESMKTSTSSTMELVMD